MIEKMTGFEREEKTDWEFSINFERVDKYKKGLTLTE